MKKVKLFYIFLQLYDGLFPVRQYSKKTDNYKDSTVFLEIDLPKNPGKPVVFNDFHYTALKKIKKIKKILKKLLTFEKKWCIITFA